MELLTQVKNGVTIISVSGSLDAVSVNDFDAEWKKALENSAAKILIELQGVNYISSAGLRGILLLAKTAKQKQTPLAFSGMQAMVADMFKLSGFYTILTTYPTEAAALAAMA